MLSSAIYFWKSRAADQALARRPNRKRREKDRTFCWSQRSLIPPLELEQSVALPLSCKKALLTRDRQNYI